MAESVKTSASSGKKAAASTAVKKTVSSKTPATQTRTAKTTVTPTARKTTTKADTAKSAPAKITAKPASTRKKSVNASSVAESEKIATARIISPEQRYQMIATAAYYLAERRGFAAGHEIQDWITAEAEINAQLLAA